MMHLGFQLERHARNKMKIKLTTNAISCGPTINLGICNIIIKMQYNKFTLRFNLTIIAIGISVVQTFTNAI